MQENASRCLGDWWTQQAVAVVVSCCSCSACWRQRLCAAVTLR